MKIKNGFDRAEEFNNLALDGFLDCSGQVLGEFYNVPTEYELEQWKAEEKLKMVKVVSLKKDKKERKDKKAKKKGKDKKKSKGKNKKER